MVDPRSILAFVHIEKAAGTTLIHILRRNFLIRYCDVRPLGKESQNVFRAADLKKTLRILPSIKCIAGHSVRPLGDLHDNYPGMRFITLLRDPVKRYVSQYQYLTYEMNHKFGFEEFLENPEFRNFQTKKLTGTENLEAAIEILSTRFFLVGVVEEFDEFLVMLKKKLEHMTFDPSYERVNTAREKSLAEDLVSRYHDEIVENNKLDLALYDHVRHMIIPRNRDWYGTTLAEDLESFRAQQAVRLTQTLKAGIDYFVRKIYVQTATGVLRRLGGLPTRGSY